MRGCIVRACFLFSVFLGLLACSRPAEVETTGFIVDGLQVIFKDTPGNPVVAGGFYLKGGTNYVGTRQAGIEIFLFYTAIQGTKTRTKDELNARLESMGTSFDVAAGYDYTGLTFQCILDRFDPSWEIFTDVLLHPRFDPRELELVRQRMIAVIEAENDRPGRNVRRVANDLFYEGHPYGVSVHGFASTAAGLSRKELLQYHRGDVTKNRALLVIVGDLDLQDVTHQARELASQLPLGPELRLPALVFDPGRPDLAVARRNLPTNYILGLFTAPRPGHPDYPAFTAAMRILSDRLQEELPNRPGLSTDPGAGFDRRIANHGYFHVTTTRPDSTVMVIFQTIDQMIHEPIPETRLKHALATSITRQLLDNESALNQLEQLASWEIVGEDWQKADQYLPEVRALRPEDIQAVMRKYVRNFHFGVVGDPRRVSKRLFTSR
ncbi:MAG: insulinase family protein [Fidelibacterota bacterium]|nr:MAG: insulinase family protein [Candidatus Neomarinimicrobiota bacterium]